MEAETKREKRKEPQAWLIKNGVRTRFVAEKPERLSVLGIWLQEHPDGFGRVLDMRAVMK